MLQDVRYAIRGMRRSPGFTAVAILSLALGIGANTAIFSLVEAAMLRMLPVDHPEQLVEVLQKVPGQPRGNGYWSRKSFEHFRDKNHVFSGVLGTSIDNQMRLAPEGGEQRIGIGEYVTGNYFADLGVKPVIGRLIGPGDKPGMAVVSWAMWIDRFHKEPDVLGKRILVQDVPATIVGVAPRGFVGLRVEAKTDVWVPQKPGEIRQALLARLKPGVTLEQARAEMAVLYRFTMEEWAASSRDASVRQVRVEVEPAGNGLATMRDRFGKPLTVLMSIVGLLLLLTCVNIASMLLARAAGREREMAVRTSLGASGSRLLRQVLTESLVLSAAGTLLGTAVAYFGTSALLRILASGRVHERVYLRVQPDFQVLLFTGLIAVIAGVIFGVAPAWTAFRTSPVLAIRQTGSVGETPVRRLFAKALVTAQISLSILLLSTGALFSANLASLEEQDLGFHRDHVLLVSLDASSSGYSGERLSGAYADLLDRMEKIPGVRSASFGLSPLSGAGASGIAAAEGFEEPAEDVHRVGIGYVGPRYFETLGMPLLAGRDFTVEDQARRNVAIVSRAFAHYYFAGRNPICKHVTLDQVTLVPGARTYEIVGVVGDANYLEIREKSLRTIYLPSRRARAQTFLIHTNIDPQGAVRDVSRTIASVAPGVTIARTITLADQIDASIVPERLMAGLSGFFAALGAVLAGIGLYGLLAYTVARRTNEIGIRMALGASAGDVTWLILRDTLITLAGGLVIGLPLAVWGRAVAASLVQGLPESNSGPIAAAVAGIVVVGLAASLAPVFRAARVDPIEAVRHE